MTELEQLLADSLNRQTEQVINLARQLPALTRQVNDLAGQLEQYQQEQASLSERVKHLTALLQSSRR